MYSKTLKSVAAIMLLAVSFPMNAATHSIVGKGDVMALKMPEIIKRETLKNGHTLEYLRSDDGSISKRIVMNGVSNMPMTVRQAPVQKAETEYSAPFSEMFETWDGETFDWIPEGWQDISKTDPPHVAPAERALNFTWQVEPGGWDVNVEGQYSARVQNCFYTDPEDNTKMINEPQDEWLITPTVKITENNVLYFYLGYHPGWTLLNMEEWTFGNINNIMEVHVSENGGETWRKMWDCIEDAYSYSNQELLDDLQSITVTWVPVRVDLSEYKDKSIQVAFRYVGVEGESMRIDAVSIKRPEPQAYYIAPTGAFNNGFSPAFELSESKALLYGAYNNCTWLNYSNMDSESFEWSYSTDSDEVLSTDDIDLSYYCYPGQYAIPSLTAKATYAEPSTFKMDLDYIQLGGNNTTENAEGKIVEYSACNYNIDNSIGVYQIEDYYLFGTGSSDLWTDWYALEGRTVTLNAVCNYFPEPNHTYYFTKVWVNAIVEANANAEFVMEALNVEDNGISVEPFATATCKGDDITFYTVDGQTYATIMFDFGEPITVEHGMMLKLSGFNDENSVSKFIALNQFYPNTNGMNYAYGFVTVTDGKDSVDTLVASSSLITGMGALNTAFCFNMDATFTWLECSNTEFYAPEEETSKGFKFMSEFSGDDFSVEGDGVGDWITYKLGAYDAEEKTQLITFTVATNPGAARSSDVKVRVPGSIKTVKISQDQSSGVESVATNHRKAEMTGSTLLVEGLEGESFEIFNAAGTSLGKYTLTSNSISVDMSAAPAGVYMARFVNAETIKFVK